MNSFFFLVPSDVPDVYGPFCYWRAHTFFFLKHRFIPFLVEGSPAGVADAALFIVDMFSPTKILPPPRTTDRQHQRALASFLPFLRETKGEPPNFLTTGSFSTESGFPMGSRRPVP